MALLEVIGFTTDACMKIEQAGAHRIELCDNPADGGTTPSYGFIKTVKSQVSIDVFPMIRPRGGDFLYSPTEYETMHQDISVCKTLGCEGVVFGMLMPDGNIDKVRCRKLVELAYPMETTFHRAFDRVNNPAQALEDIIECGFTRILTSGSQKTALAGAVFIQELIKQADDRIIIMPGSGVRASTLAEIAEKTGAVEFHSSARIELKSQMIYQNPALDDNLVSMDVDVQDIRSMIEILKG